MGTTLPNAILFVVGFAVAAAFAILPVETMLSHFVYGTCSVTSGSPIAWLPAIFFLAHLFYYAITILADVDSQIEIALARFAASPLTWVHRWLASALSLPCL